MSKKYFDVVLKSGTYKVKNIPLRDKHLIMPLVQQLYMGAIDLLNDKAFIDKIFKQVEGVGMEEALKKAGIPIAEANDFQKQLDQYALMMFRDEAFKQNALKHFIGVLGSKARLDMLEVFLPNFGQWSETAQLFVPFTSEQTEDILADFGDSEKFLVTCIKETFGDFFLASCEHAYQDLFKTVEEKQKQN